MAPFDVHPWARFLTGMLIGCWFGAAIACAGLLLVVGRRIRQLEAVNLLLRTKLKARAAGISVRRTGTTGPMLVMPMPGSARRSESPLPRIARVN